VLVLVKFAGVAPILTVHELIQVLVRVHRILGAVPGPRVLSPVRRLDRGIARPVLLTIRPLLDLH